MLSVLPIFSLISELVWQKFINFPPTLEQLNLGFNTPVLLWTARFFSLMLLVFGFSIISKKLKRSEAKYFWLLAMFSPLISLIWMSYPMEALVFFLLSGSSVLLATKVKSLKAAAIISVILVAAVNLVIFSNKPKLYEDISLKKAQEEITFRINIEDTTIPGIRLPLVIRRIAYNKYFFVIKHVSESVLGFFDLETLFFQDIHPMGQKAFPVLFWPAVLLLLIAWSMPIKIEASVKKLLVILSAVAFTYYMTSSSTSERRQLFTLIPITIIMAYGISHSLNSKYKFLKSFVIMLFVLNFYGYATNLFDRFRRPEFWLDNRTLAYQYLLENLNSNNVNFSKAYIPDTLYAYDKYCPYFKTDCSKISIKNFQLTSENTEMETLYIGFNGNFLGLTRIGAEEHEIKQYLENNNFKVLGIKNLNDNIASGYGQKLIMAIRQR